MAGNTDGNIMGTKPVIGKKTDEISGGQDNVTAMTILKRLQARLGLGAFGFGFNGDADVYGDRTAKSIYEIERHLHGHEKWFGVAAVAVGETHVADRMGGAIAPFALLSGNSDFGDWVQILGSSDTPVKPGHKKFDAHRILVTTTDSTVSFCIQVANGEEGELPDLVAAEDYSDFGYKASTNNNDSGINDIMDRRASVGSKVWARCCCIGQNAKTINFYFGIHEYLY
jgi:hypothetical protein